MIYDVVYISNTYDEIAAYFRIHNVFDGLAYIFK